MSGKVSLLVEVTLKDGQKEAFVARVSDHAKRCLEREPGCLSFSVLCPDDMPNTVYLCEIYADDDAITHHLGTDYMAQYLEDTGPMVADKTRHRCVVAA